MLILIGRIYSTDGKTLEACRLIDSETKEMKIISYEKVKEAVLRGEIIKGFKLFESINYVSGSVKKSIVKEKGKFAIYKVPELNGKGELIRESDKNKLVVYGWKGFAEAKEFHLINYKGEEVILNVEQFTKKVKDGEVNGAVINKKTGRPMIMADFNNELS